MVAITLLLEGVRGGTAPAVRFDPRRAAAAAGAPLATDDDAVVGPASPAPEEDPPRAAADGPASDAAALVSAEDRDAPGARPGTA